MIDGLFCFPHSHVLCTLYHYFFFYFFFLRLRCPGLCLLGRHLRTWRNISNVLLPLQLIFLTLFDTRTWPCYRAPESTFPGLFS
jgi:hypothetical protein